MPMIGKGAQALSTPSVVFARSAVRPTGKHLSFTLNCFCDAAPPEGLQTYRWPFRFARSGVVFRSLASPIEPPRQLQSESRGTGLRRSFPLGPLFLHCI